MKTGKIFGIIIKLAIIVASVVVINWLAPKSGGYIAAIVGFTAAIVARIVTVWKRNRFSAELKLHGRPSQEPLVTRNPEAFCLMILTLAQANDWHLDIYLEENCIAFYGHPKRDHDTTLMQCTIMGPANKILWRQENTLAQRVSALVVDKSFGGLDHLVHI